MVDIHISAILRPMSANVQVMDGHPYGVEPFGNVFLRRIPSVRPAGLGLLNALDVS